MKVYYRMPGLQVNTDGLREINDPDSIGNMRAFVTFRHYFMDIYLDHDETIRDLDDVVRFPVVKLPPVISPVKLGAMEAQFKHIKVVRPIVEEAELMCAPAVLKKKGKRVVDMDVANNAKYGDEMGDVNDSGDAIESSDDDSDIDYNAKIAYSDHAISKGDDGLYVNNFFDEEEKINEEHVEDTKDDELHRT